MSRISENRLEPINCLINHNQVAVPPKSRGFHGENIFEFKIYYYWRVVELGNVAI